MPIRLLAILIMVAVNTFALGQQKSATGTTKKIYSRQEGSVKEIIIYIVKSKGYQVKFTGQDSLNKIYELNLDTTLDASQLLSILNKSYSFAYFVKKDVVTVDDYLIYSTNKPKHGDSFIKIQFDPARSVKAIVFQNISPSILLDTILELTHNKFKNKTQSSETVSGIIPLDALQTGLINILETHDWIFDQVGKIPIIRNYAPGFGAIKDTYSIDTFSVIDSTYTIFTNQPQNGVKEFIFKHLALEDLFRIIEKNNNYRLSFDRPLRKKTFVSGRLPLELPLETFIKLMTTKHQLYFKLYNNLVIFEEHLSDVQNSKLVPRFN